MSEPPSEQPLPVLLGRFGFSDREAALFLAALRRGRATARELTRDAEVDRVLGYRLLDGMRARGWIEATAERPRRFLPVAPTHLFERHLKSRRQRLEEDERVARELSVRLEAALQRGSPGASRYQLLTGPANIYAYLEEMAARAREEMQVMLTFRALRESLAHGLERAIGPFIAGGGAFRLVVEDDPRLAPTFARFRRTLRRFRQVEIRVVAPQPSRLTIVDHQEALLFLVPEARERSSDQVAVWTDHPGFVAGQRSYFERTWRAARAALGARSEAAGPGVAPTPRRATSQRSRVRMRGLEGAPRRSR